jgi:hypothetical protein
MVLQEVKLPNTFGLLTMATSKSLKSKAAWDQARRYAAKHRITVIEARTKLSQAAKSKPAKKLPSPSPRRIFAKQTDKSELAHAERELRKKYPHIIEGSLKAHTSGPHKGRRTVEIACHTKGCKNKRTIHTSDAFQVKLCLKCTQARKRS